MSSPKSPDTRQGLAYLLLLWSSGIAMLAGACALLVLMLGTVIGPFRFLEVARDDKSNALGVWIDDFPITPSAVLMALDKV